MSTELDNVEAATIQKPQVFLKSITFNDGTKLPLNHNSVIVFTGANNSGKSQVLRDAEADLDKSNSSPTIVIKDKKIPRVNVVFADLVDDRKVVDTIMILMRFFSLVIGKISIVEDVRLDLDGKDMKMWLFLNRDFSVHYSWDAYWMRNRYQFEDVHDSLLQWFEKWYSFSCDESYEILQEAYFQSCSKKPSFIEDVFLTYCRFMEGYDLRKSCDEEIAQELESDILSALSEGNFKNVISPFFVKAASKYKPKDAAQWISAGFLGRIGLDSRIKRLDATHFSFIEVNRERICKGIDVNGIYGKISKTRNYYAHYKADKSGMTNNEQLIEPLCFLREREVVHYQRFGECLMIVQGVQNRGWGCGCKK